MPWLIDQTLFATHLKLGCEGNLLSFGHVAKQFQAKNVFVHFQKHHATDSACEAMFCDMAKGSNIVCEANPKFLTNNV